MHSDIMTYFQNIRIKLLLSLVSLSFDIGIDPKIGVIVVSPTIWEAHYSPREKPEMFYIDNTRKL